VGNVIAGVLELPKVGVLFPNEEGNPENGAAEVVDVLPNTNSFDLAVEVDPNEGVIADEGSAPNTKSDGVEEVVAGASNAGVLNAKATAVEGAAVCVVNPKLNAGFSCSILVS